MNLKRTLLLSATALTFAVAASACSSDGTSSDTASADSMPAEVAPSETTSDPSAPGSSSSDSVEISKSRFDPNEIAVEVGDTVTFRNNDGFDHTVTSKDDAPTSFDSGELGQDQTFEVEFTEAGTYDYFCEIHPTMRANVIVG